MKLLKNLKKINALSDLTFKSFMVKKQNYFFTTASKFDYGKNFRT